MRIISGNKRGGNKRLLCTVKEKFMRGFKHTPNSPPTFSLYDNTLLGKNQVIYFSFLGLNKNNSGGKNWFAVFRFFATFFRICVLTHSRN